MVNRGGNAARFVNEPIPNRSITTVFINCCPAFAPPFPSSPFFSIPRDLYLLSLRLSLFSSLLFVFESFHSQFSFSNGCQIILMDRSREIPSVYFLSVRLFFLSYLSFDPTFSNLFPTAAKLLLWIVVVAEKFLPIFLLPFRAIFISCLYRCPIVYLSLSFFLSLICLRIFRFNVFQSFSNSCQIIIAFMD